MSTKSRPSINVKAVLYINPSISFIKSQIKNCSNYGKETSERSLKKIANSFQEATKRLNVTTNIPKLL